jgi:polysaccharide export outer membrane protein
MQKHRPAVFIASILLALLSTSAWAQTETLEAPLPLPASIHDENTPPLAGYAISDSPKTPAATSDVRPLPTAPSDPPTHPSVEAEWCFRQCVGHTRAGADLANRGACFAARAELTTALRRLSQGLDARQQSTSHGRALARGFQAIEEAADFLARTSSAEREADPAARAEAENRFAVLQASAGAEISPFEAARRQAALAEKALVEGVAAAPMAAEPLRDLGKIYEILAQQQAVDACSAELMAIAFYRAALTVAPAYHQSANDLGVLLARGGHLAEARSALEYSLSLDRHPAVAKNLAVVYRELGQTELADQVQREAERTHAATPEELAPGAVQWVDPATLAHLSGQMPGMAADVWNAYAQGQYVGPARTSHVAQYRLRVDDQLDIVFRQNRQPTNTPYRLSPGDEIQVQSVSKPAEINNARVIIQPDGMIMLSLVGEVRAADHTLPELRDNLEQIYQRFFPTPAIIVTPLKVNTRVQDLLDTVDRRYGAGGGLARSVLVMPDGSITVPDAGTLCAQGLTVPELRFELDERYRARSLAVAVSPVLSVRAPRYVYVLGEVFRPGRFELVAPTTASQAIGLAGSWIAGANLRQIVVLRRGEQWQLMGSVINLNDALYAKKPCPQQDIWLADSDVVIVPKGNLRKADDFIELVFTRGIYSVFPMSTVLNFNKTSTL